MAPIKNKKPNCVFHIKRPVKKNSLYINIYTYMLALTYIPLYELIFKVFIENSI